MENVGSLCNFPCRSNARAQSFVDAAMKAFTKYGCSLETCRKSGQAGGAAIGACRALCGNVQVAERTQARATAGGKADQALGWLETSDKGVAKEILNALKETYANAGCDRDWRQAGCAAFKSDVATAQQSYDMLTVTTTTQDASSGDSDDSNTVLIVVLVGLVLVVAFGLAAALYLKTKNEKFVNTLQPPGHGFGATNAMYVRWLRRRCKL